MKVTFTPDQARYAQEVVKNLLTVYRFFIKPQNTERSVFKYFFDRKIFSKALEIQETLFKAYDKIKEDYKDEIFKKEKELGFVASDLPKDRSVVTFNKYNGGFDIKSVLPLSFLFEDIDLTKEGIFAKIYAEFNKGVKDTISELETDRISKEISEISLKIFDQYEKVRYNENLCVVLMRSRFDVRNGTNIDHLSEKFDGIKYYPELLGYLFYQKSKEVRLIRNDYVRFDLKQNPYIMFMHQKDNEPNINFFEKSEFGLKIIFAGIF